MSPEPKHFDHSNKITTKNFAEVVDHVRFSLNIYRGTPSDVNFEKFTFAFLARQVEESYADQDGLGDIPAIKGVDGKWDTRGHRERVMKIDHQALSVIHSLSEDESVPVEQARFIQPYSARTLEVFRQLARFPKLDAAIPKIERTISSATGEQTVEIPLWQMSPYWHETGAQKDGLIKRETAFRDADEMIVQGPLFHVGNPLYKTPKAVSRTNADYAVIDATSVPADYLSRTNYGPAVEKSEYHAALGRCRWDPTKSHANFYRLALRRMVAIHGERSLIGCLLPPGTAHVNTVESIAFADERNVLDLHSFVVSIIADFLTKAAGRGDIFDSTVAGWPWVDSGSTARHRSLRLASLTSAYVDLWNRNASTQEVISWSSPDPRLRLEGPVEGPATWDRTAGLRSEFARRMALVEIDVLVAQALGLTLDQLIEIYRIYFPVLQENEAGTWYDQNGRIVWTCSKGLPGVGWLDDRGKSPGRAAWERILADNPSDLTCTATDDTMPGGPRTVTRHFVGPFTRCDRIEDYKRAWAHFERLSSEKAA